MEITLSIFFFVVSAIFRTLDQLVIHDERWKRSWLSEKLFTWDTISYVTDPFHTYQGGKLISFGLACYFFPYSVWWLIPAILLYYQLFNYLFHDFFIRKEKKQSWIGMTKMEYRTFFEFVGSVFKKNK